MKQAPSAPLAALSLAPPSGNATPWLITFVDMISLMLVFFVMLYSMRTPDIPQYKEVVRSFAPSRPFVETVLLPAEKGQEMGIRKTFTRRAISTNYLGIVLQDKFKKNPVFKDIGLVFLENAVRIEIALPGLSLSPETQETLKALGEIFALMSNAVEMTVQADDFTAARTLGKQARQALKAGGYANEIPVLVGQDVKDRGPRLELLILSGASSI